VGARPGEHHVEDDDVKSLGGRQGEALPAGARHVDGVPLLGETPSDWAVVLKAGPAEGERVTIPVGTFESRLKTGATTPLETEARQYKLYASGTSRVRDEPRAWRPDRRIRDAGQCDLRGLPDLVLH
jgi:hypothetical protein